MSETFRDAAGRFRSATVEERSLRPVDHTDEPNENPAGVAPASVAEPDYDPATATPPGVEFDDGPPAPPWPRSMFHASPWDGWPEDWNLPVLGGVDPALVDTAWMALDLNSSVFASMPPYLVKSSETLPDEWLDNPDPDKYDSWAEFADSLMWEYQLGEAFVLCTARYANGWPARFHVAPSWTISVEIDGNGLRRYSIGGAEVQREDVLHIRYRSRVDDAHGHGPLEAGRARLVAAAVLLRYLTNFVQGGAIPSGVLESEEDLTAKQSSQLHEQWITARMARLGLPAVLSGGVTWKPTQVNALDTALTELAGYTEAKISVLLGVPPFLLGLPSGGDSMTYSNVSSVYDYHWRGGLRPKASRLMLALSSWLVPRGTMIEVNRDEYVRPGPLERAQIWQIYKTLGVVDTDEIRDAERFAIASRTSATQLSGAFK